MAAYLDWPRSVHKFPLGRGLPVSSIKEESGEEEEVKPLTTRTERSAYREPMGSEACKSAVSAHQETESMDKKLKVPAPSCDEETSEMRRRQVDTCWFNMQDVFMDPDSRAAYLWMALVTMAVIYNWFFVILRIAFEDMREYPLARTAFPLLDIVCDIIYFLDIGVQSRTAYLEDGCLVRDLRQTVRHYYNRPHFLLDLMSVLPMPTMLGLASLFHLKFHLLITAEGAGIPVHRLLRLLKYHSMSNFFEKTDSRTNSPYILRAFKLSLHMWLVIHWTGCFYYILSQYEGLGTNDWVYPSDPAMASFRRKYLLCMFWSLMTLTTIGERAPPITEIEYIFTGLTFLAGVFVFATVVGNVGDVISNMNAARHDFQAKMDQIKFYLNHRNVPEHLQDSIKRWAEYTWARTMAIDEPTVLQLLPNRLRTEVAIHVHLATLKKVRIFKQCEDGLLQELVLKLRPSIYSPGEYICRIGEIGREMYIIDHGKVEILLPDPGTKVKKQVAIMTAGNYFGEISLLKLDDGQNKRTADVRSIGFSELLCLSRHDLMSALTEYPEARKILEAQARQRMQQTKRSSLNGATGQGVSNPDQSGSVTENSPPHAPKSLADVTKSEGLSKLYDGKTAQELNELRTLLKELKEVKTYLADATLTQLKRHCTTLEAGLKTKEEELQHLRAQLTNQRISQQEHSGVTSNNSSASMASPTLSSPSAGINSTTSSPRSQRISGAIPRVLERLVVRPCGGDNESSGPSAQGKLESTSTARALSKPMSTFVKVMPPFSSVASLRTKGNLPDYFGPDSLAKTKQQKNDNANKDSGTDASHMTTDSSRSSFSPRRVRTREREPTPQTSASFTVQTPSSPIRENRDRSSFSFSRLERHQLEGKYPYFLADRGGDAVPFLSHPRAQTSFCSSMGSVVGSRSSFEIVSPALMDKEQAHNSKKKEVEYEEDATEGKHTTAVKEAASIEWKANTTSSESSTQDTSTTYSTTSSTNTHSGNKPARPRPKYKPLENPGYSSSILMLGKANVETLNAAQADKPNEETDIAKNNKLNTSPGSTLAKGDVTTPSVDVREQKPTILSECGIAQSDKEAPREESSGQSGCCTDVLGKKPQDEELSRSECAVNFNRFGKTTRFPKNVYELFEDGHSEEFSSSETSPLAALVMDPITASITAVQSSQSVSCVEENDGGRERGLDRHRRRKTVERTVNPTFCEKAVVDQQEKIRDSDSTADGERMQHNAQLIPQTKKPLKTCRKIDDKQLSALLAKRREISTDTCAIDLAEGAENDLKTQNEKSKDKSWENSPDQQSENGQQTHVSCPSRDSYKRFSFGINTSSTKTPCGSLTFQGFGVQSQSRSPFNSHPLLRTLGTEGTESTHLTACSTYSVENKPKVSARKKNYSMNADTSKNETTNSVSGEVNTKENIHPGSTERTSESFEVKKRACGGISFDTSIDTSTDPADSTHSTSASSEIISEELISAEIDAIADGSVNPSVSDSPLVSPHSSSENSEYLSPPLSSKKSKKVRKRYRQLDRVFPIGLSALKSSATEDQGAPNIAVDLSEETKSTDTFLSEENTLAILRRRHSAFKFRGRSLSRSHDTGSASSDSSNSPSPEVSRRVTGALEPRGSVAKKQKYSSRLSPLISRFEDKKKSALMRWMQDNTETLDQQQNTGEEQCPTFDKPPMDDTMSSSECSEASPEAFMSTFSDVPGSALVENEMRGKIPHPSPAFKRRALRRKQTSKRFTSLNKDTPKCITNNTANQEEEPTSSKQSSKVMTITEHATESSKNKTLNLSFDLREIAEAQDPKPVAPDQKEAADEEHFPEISGHHTVKRLSECALQVFAATSRTGGLEKQDEDLFQLSEISARATLSSLTLTQSNVSLYMELTDDETKECHTEESDSCTPSASGSSWSCFSQQTFPVSGIPYTVSTFDNPLDYYKNTKEHPPMHSKGRLSYKDDEDVLAESNVNQPLLYRNLASEDTRHHYEDEISSLCPQNTSARAHPNELFREHVGMEMEENAEELADSFLVHQNKSASARRQKRLCVKYHPPCHSTSKHSLSGCAYIADSLRSSLGTEQTGSGFSIMGCTGSLVRPNPPPRLLMLGMELFRGIKTGLDGCNAEEGDTGGMQQGAADEVNEFACSTVQTLGRVLGIQTEPSLSTRDTSVVGGEEPENAAVKGDGGVESCYSEGSRMTLSEFRVAWNEKSDEKDYICNIYSLGSDIDDLTGL